jgi:HK97 family phage prohead protease
LPILFNHYGVPIGFSERAYETGRGLVVEGRLLLEDLRAKSVLRLMNERALTQFSFGFLVDPGGARTVRENGVNVRELSKVRLYEISVVLAPANAQTSRSTWTRRRRIPRSNSIARTSTWWGWASRRWRRIRMPRAARRSTSTRTSSGGETMTREDARRALLMNLTARWAETAPLEGSVLLLERMAELTVAAARQTRAPALLRVLKPLQATIDTLLEAVEEDAPEASSPEVH